MSTKSTHTTTPPAELPSPGHMAMNGVKAIADVGVLPGLSRLLDGHVKSGVLHVLTALVAGSVFGPLGWYAVGANSFSKSVSGKHLYQHFVNVEPAEPTEHH